MQDLDNNAPEMQEIKNEETIIKDAPMWIDSSTRLENIVTVISFIAIIILTIYTGVVETPATTSQKSVRLFKESNIQRLSFDAAPISSYNRYISFEINFIKKEISKDVDVPVSFQYYVTCSSNEKSVNKTVETIYGTARSKPGNNVTQSFHLFNDRLIDYQSIEIVIMMDKTKLQDFKGIVIYTELGTNDQTTFQSYFRLVYSLFCLSSLFSLINKMRMGSHVYLHQEQKLLVPLIICSVLSNNPFYVFHAYYPGHLYFFLSAFGSALFEGCICIGILIVFEYILEKDFKYDLEHLQNKLIYCGLIAFSHFLHQLHYAIGTYSNPPINGRSTAEIILRMIEVLLLCGFVFWAFSLFFKCISAIDITERGKIYLYSYANFLVLAGMIIFNIIATTFNLFKNNLLTEISEFVISNIYVLIMIYYHWPYALNYEQDYVNEGDAKDNSHDQIVDLSDIADPMANENKDLDEDVDDEDEEEEEEEE